MASCMLTFFLAGCRGRSGRCSNREVLSARQQAPWGCGVGAGGCLTIQL